MKALLGVEIRRFTARRTVRMLGALVLLGMIAAGSLTFAFSNRDVAGATRRERARATAEYQSCLSGVGEAAVDEEGKRLKCEEPNLASIIADPRFHLRSLKDAVTQLSGFLIVLGLALGATFVGAEWHHRTMTTTLTWESRRVRVVLSKILACSAVVFATTIVFQALLSGALLPAAIFRGTTEGTTAGWLAHTIGNGLRGATAAGFAAALGAMLALLTRSTAFALGITFAWLTIAEGLVRNFRPGWTLWLISNNVAGFVGATADEATRSALSSGLLLAIYIAGLGAVAIYSFRRRDVA